MSTPPYAFPGFPAPAVLTVAFQTVIAYRFENSFLAHDVTPDKFNALRATLERLAATVKAKPPSINQQAIFALQGTWMLYSGGYSGGSSATGSTSHSHEETVVFDGRGRFQYQSSSSVMLNTPGSGGSYGGGAGSAGSDSDQGTYTVIDRTLVTKGTKGQLAVDIQLQGDRLVAGGKTYLRSR